MNPITYSLERIIKFSIPSQLLNLAFLSRLADEHHTLDTLESKIREHVIDARIIPDCNLVHGTLMNVPLAKCTRLDGDYYTSTWHVPKVLTQGKKITSVLHVTAASGTIATNSPVSASTSSGIFTTMMTGYQQMGAVFSANNQAVNSVSPVQIVSNALTYLVGENTVLIKDTVIIPATMHLRIMVENDENFNHIPPSMYPDFFKFITLAVKAYIYNKLIIESDTVFINSGGAMNKMQEILESYADAEELYMEALDPMIKSLHLADPEMQRRHYQIFSPQLN